jgi:hypothetical protein
MLRANISTRIAISVVAVCLILVHLLIPVPILDTPTILLAMIAFLPWLQPVVKSVELMGVKLELQDLKEKVTSVQGAAESASQQAMLAIATPRTLTDQRSMPLEASAPGRQLESLAREYEQIRATQKSGEGRTRSMTEIVGKMIEVSGRVENFNVVEALASPESGTRLSAYAYLYVNKDSRFLNELVQSVTQQEVKPFGQYWGLIAISRVLDNVAGPIPKTDLELLSRFEATIPPGTDRDYEVRRILARVKDLG